MPGYFSATKRIVIKLPAQATAIEAIAAALDATADTWNLLVMFEALAAGRPFGALSDRARCCAKRDVK
jgi:hypothetical protein